MVHGQLDVFDSHRDVMERAVPELGHPSRDDAGSAALVLIGLVDEQGRIARLSIHLREPVLVLERLGEAVPQAEKFLCAPVDVVRPEGQVIGKGEKPHPHVVQPLLERSGRSVARDELSDTGSQQVVQLAFWLHVTLVWRGDE